MLELQSGFSTQVLHQKEDRATCCRTRSCAASAGHYQCFERLTPYGPENKPEELFLIVRIALGGGHMAFASRVFEDKSLRPNCFAEYCIRCEDAVSLQFVMAANPGINLERLCRYAASNKCIGSLRVLLENGASWDPCSLLEVAMANRLDILELVLSHSSKWCKQVPTIAAQYDHLRFLMHIFEAGCPSWTSASDREPGGFAWSLDDEKAGHVYAMSGDSTFRDIWEPEARCLMVSSDLLVSGPVLLYAAKTGAPMTPRMEEMLGEVRGRALALAGCFFRARHLRGGPAADPQLWNAMGGVPVKVVQRIATLAKISIVCRDLVE